MDVVPRAVELPESIRETTTLTPDILSGVSVVGGEETTCADYRLQPVRLNLASFTPKEAAINQRHHSGA